MTPRIFTLYNYFNTKMNRYQIFKQLRKHRKLAEKRAINFEQNKVAKWLVWILGLLMVGYLMFFAVMLAMVANDSSSTTALELIFGLMPIVLIIDFFVRFMAQQTPAQLVKPYILLPIPKNVCIDSFVLTSLANTSNLIWFAMLVPFALMSVLFSYGFWATIGMLLCYYLFILANSQWYSIVRTLINNTLKWWVLPICVYAIAALPIIINGGKEKGFEQFFDFYASIGTAIENGSILPYLIALALLLVLAYINRQLQIVNVWREISRVEKTTHLKSVSRFSFLDRYGEIGQYIQLEIKTIMRNKNPRKGFIFATAIVLMFSLLISFTTVYDNRFMTNFWCIYNYVIYGAMMVLKVMCNEGNYIDCLMVRRENILKLLRAKYIFYCLLLFLPFLLMLPTVFSGKWSLLMLVAYGVFTAGFQYFLLFQMAVYNKQTTPLNTKFLSKNGMENNYYQLLVEMIAFFVPLPFISLLQTLLSDTVAYLTMLFIGIAFIVTYPIWMRNIYQRMMKRKYILLEGFRASR